MLDTTPMEVNPYEPPRAPDPMYGDVDGEQARLVERNAGNFKPRDAFGVAVRTIGLLAACYGVWSITFEFVATVAAQGARTENKLEYASSGLLLLGLGVLLLRCATWFVNFAYPELIPSSARAVDDSESHSS
jgi:hypothetical protein